MCLFGTKCYNWKLRLASLFVIFKYEKDFLELLKASNGSEKEVTLIDCTRLIINIDHIEDLVKEVSKDTAWGENVIMLALSFIINRPIQLY